MCVCFHFTTRKLAFTVTTCNVWSCGWFLVTRAYVCGKLCTDWSQHTCPFGKAKTTGQQQTFHWQGYDKHTNCTKIVHRNRLHNIVCNHSKLVCVLKEQYSVRKHQEASAMAVLKITKATLRERQMYTATKTTNTFYCCGLILCPRQLTIIFSPWKEQYNVLQVQWSLTITATYGPNICGCYRQVAALQRCKCTESYHPGLDWVAVIKRWVTIILRFHCAV